MRILQQLRHSAHLPHHLASIGGFTNTKGGLD
ncbi:hypothetical protein BH23GEM6_BH23GEM6_07860 [soil metagenome]